MCSSDLVPQLADEVFDLPRGDLVERCARLVHQEDLRIDGQGPCDAQSLLLPARQDGGASAKAILHLRPVLPVLFGEGRIHDWNSFLSFDGGMPKFMHFN